MVDSEPGNSPPEWLENYSQSALLEIARFNEMDTTVNGKQMRKKELLSFLGANLFTRQRVESALARLSPVERDVLDRLILRKGEYPTDDFRRELAEEGIVTDDSALQSDGRPHDFHPGSRRPPKPDSFGQVMARLTRHGLVFSKEGRTFYSYSYKLDIGQGNTLFIPQEIRPFLPTLQEPSLEIKDGETGRVCLADAGAFQRDLFIYWNYLQQNPIKLLQAGTIPRRHMRQINKQLLVPDEEAGTAAGEEDAGRIFFLRIMLEELGLARRENNWLKALGQGALPPPFWGWTSTERTKICLETWLGSKSWSEIPYRAELVGMVNLQGGRAAVIGLLSRQTAGQWLSALRFRNRLSAFNKGFLFPRKMGEAQRWQSYPHDDVRLKELFSERETAFVEAALRGPLHWLGLLDVCINNRKASSFRLTPMTAHLLQGGEEPPPAGGARLLVQPNFQILAIGPVTDAVLARLELFADRVRISPAAVEYNVSRDSVYRAQRLGMKAQDILAFLADIADAELPQNVRRSLEEWDELHGRIVFRSGVTLCQTAGPEMLDDLLSDGSLDGQLRRLSSTVAQVNKKDIKKLLEALERREIQPSISGNRPEQSMGALTVDEEGRITFAHRVPSFYLEGRIRRLAEPDGSANGYRLTPESIGKAVHLGLKVPQILAELEELQKAPPAPALVRRIKAWSGYYGKVGLSSPVLLLQFRDGDTLHELLDDPEIGAIVRPFVPSRCDTLAEVSQADLKKLLDLLAERGLEIERGKTDD